MILTASSKHVDANNMKKKPYFVGTSDKIGLCPDKIGFSSLKMSAESFQILLVLTTSELCMRQRLS
jgi:hypothetical protein